MSDHDDDPGREPDDDRDLRSLMGESDYSGRPRDEFKRGLLRELNHNFRYHRLRSRALAFAVVVMAAGTVLWRANDVGSDSFELRPTGRMVNGGEVVEAPLSGTRFHNIPAEGDTDGGLAATQELYAQLAAGDLELLGVEIWIIDGHTTQFLWREVQRDGETFTLTQARGGTKQSARRLRQLRAGSRQADLAAIKEGRLAPHRTETIRMEGRDFTLGVWVWDTPTDGRVTYKRSLP